MEQQAWKARKVVVVGAGAVGSTFAYTLAQSGLCDEIVLIDKSRELVKGQILDLSHGLSFYPNVRICVGKKSDYRDAQVIVITAGAKQRAGESRLDLLKRNIAIIEEIVDEIVAQKAGGVLLIVSNPVDILTYIAHQKTGWPRGRVIGSGTVLDSARFRYLLGQHCQVDVHNVHAYVLGEHGDSQVPLWSMSNIAGIPVEHYWKECAQSDVVKMKNEIEQAVKNSAYHIIEYKGATNYAVALALLRIVGAILRNERSILTVSVPLQGEYGLREVSIGVPCLLSQKGMEQVLEVGISPEERGALEKSAAILKKTLSALESWRDN